VWDNCAWICFPLNYVFCRTMSNIGLACREIVGRSQPPESTNVQTMVDDLRHRWQVVLAELTTRRDKWVWLCLFHAYMLESVLILFSIDSHVSTRYCFLHCWFLYFAVVMVDASLNALSGNEKVFLFHPNLKASSFFKLHHSNTKFPDTLMKTVINVIILRIVLLALL
jgi:uncharacterized membrane protein YoaT (DUF817 family)